MTITSKTVSRSFAGQEYRKREQQLGPNTLSRKKRIF